MKPFAQLAQGHNGDPFSFLGIHPHASGGWVVRAFVPWARVVSISRKSRRRIIMRRVGRSGGWEGMIPPDRSTTEAGTPPAYRLAVTDGEGREWLKEDPYRFPPTLDEGRIEAFLQGRERRAHRFLGAHQVTVEGVVGTRFAVWAPAARAVNLMGDMNGWDGRCHPMRPRGATGVWELFVPEVGPGTRYKYQVVATSGDHVEKADPFARSAEVRPMTASVVPAESAFHWNDGAWLKRRQAAQSGEAALSIYEVHLGSWKRGRHHEWLGYRDLADTLLPYVRDLGFTHVELMPLTEHPLDQSWGYQPLGFFAPTSRFGSADELRYFVDRAHALGLGVLLDWVPGHFATDAHGLVAFDGTPLFEPADPRQARHPDWGTLVFDHGKPPVQSFLISSALRWIEDFHFDGLRIDAVASMLYLDYSRGEGEWVPNDEGGNENLGAVAFLRHLNDALHQESPWVVTMAEESTAWDGVSRPTSDGGLGFDQKWNMGWMNDTLRFMAEDPGHRSFHFDRITFSIVYAWSERFLLPLSHDEVVHGKGSLINKMPGNDREKFANLRLLLAYQWMHPGKKLLFMGGELAQWAEWNADGQVDWALEGFDYHTGMRRLVRDLNRLYRSEPGLHRTDFRPDGFEWLDHEDVEGMTLSFMRGEPGSQDPVLVALNFTPDSREDFVIPTPVAGRYRVVLNSDDPVYGGEGLPVPSLVDGRAEPTRGRAHRVMIPLPGFSVLVLKREAD